MYKHSFKYKKCFYTMFNYIKKIKMYIKYTYLMYFLFEIVFVENKKINKNMKKKLKSNYTFCTMKSYPSQK